MPKSAPIIKTSIPGPIARKLIERDDKVLSPSFVRWYPLVAKTGKGVNVIDVDGNK
ncbi:MAG: hypothetical protein ACTSVM_05100 [Candidatus Ranarchaeia archaeon]